MNRDSEVSATRRSQVKDIHSRSPRRWKIHVSFHSKSLKISAASIRAILTRTLRCIDVEVVPEEIREIHVLFVNDAYMREINFEFRGKDKTTDVLSFPQFQPEEVRGKKRVSKAAGSYLGDLVISTETTRRQAKRFGVTTRVELIRLLVHGVLHLCGYDHEGVPAREAQKMRRRERAIREEVLRG